MHNETYHSILKPKIKNLNQPITKELKLYQNIIKQNIN